MSLHHVALIVSVFSSAILSCHISAAWRLDCSKFVFAPKCRGVAAKRAEAASTMQLLDGNNFLSESSLRDLGDRLETRSEGQGQGQMTPEEDGDRKLQWMTGLSDRDIKNYLSAASESHRVGSKQLLAYMMSLGSGPKVAHLPKKDDSLPGAYDEGYNK